MDKETLANLLGRFTWSYSHQFHIETTVGNFEWDDLTGEITPTAPIRRMVR